MKNVKLYSKRNLGRFSITRIWTRKASKLQEVAKRRISLVSGYPLQKYTDSEGKKEIRYTDIRKPVMLIVVAAIIIIIRVHEVTSNVISNTQVAGKRKVCLCMVCMALTTTQILVTNCIDSIFQDQCVVEMLTAPELESYLAGY